MGNNKPQSSTWIWQTGGRSNRSPSSTPTSMGSSTDRQIKTDLSASIVPGSWQAQAEQLLGKLAKRNSSTTYTYWWVDEEQGLWKEDEHFFGVHFSKLQINPLERREKENETPASHLTPSFCHSTKTFPKSELHLEGWWSPTNMLRLFTDGLKHELVVSFLKWFSNMAAGVSEPCHLCNRGHFYWQA